MGYDVDDMSYYASHEILTEWLVGKTIASISRSDDAKWLRFEDAHGRALDLYADGDCSCCSESYFVSIENPEWVIGSNVSRVTIREESARRIELDYGDTKVYAFDVHSPKGTMHVEFRNDSNGRYGGMLDTSASAPEKVKWVPVTQDWIAATPAPGKEP